MRQHRHPVDQQFRTSLDNSFNEQLAFFSIHKPSNAASWDDATPVYHHLSASDIRKALAKLHQNPRNNVKDVYMNLKSGPARRLIDVLLEEENAKLAELDPTSKWILAGIDVQKETIKQWPSQKRIMKSIEVILKTEPAQDFSDDAFRPPPYRGPSDGSGSRMDQAQRNDNQRGMGGEPQVIRAPPPPPPPPPMGGQPISINGHERGEHMHVHTRQEVIPPPDHGHGHGHHHGPQSHESGVPQTVVIPIPPPPVGAGPAAKHTQVVSQQYEIPHQSKPKHGSFVDVRPAPQYITTEIIDPHVLKHQKAKYKAGRRDTQEVYDLGYESDSTCSDIGSQFSSRSVEDGTYRLVEPSRSRSRDRGRGRGGARGHSNDRVRIAKVPKLKKPRVRGHYDVDPFHEGRHSPPSKSSSPRSSVSALPTQQIFNIHIDNDNDRERERKDDRGRDIRTVEHDPRHNSNPVGASNQMYTKREKIDVHAMSRRSSVGGSDTGSSFIDSNSSIYTSDDSVFSEPMHSRKHTRNVPDAAAGTHLRSRNIPVPRHEAFMPAYHETHRRQRQSFEADDYPRRHKGSLHDDYIEAHHSTAYRQPPMAPRRHNVQLSSHFDPRYPAQPSRSYTDYARQPFQHRYTAERVSNPYEFRGMAEELSAMDYINQTRHGALSRQRNSHRHRMVPEVDEWAYRPHDRLYDGYRHL